MRGTVRARSRPIVGLGYALVATGALGGLAVQIVWGAAGVPLLGALVVVVGVALLAAEAQGTQGELRIDARGIAVGDAIVVDARDVPRRAACEIAGPRRVFLSTRLGRVDLALEDGSATDVVAALSGALGATPRFACFPSGRPLGCAAAGAGVLAWLGVLVYAAAVGVKVAGLKLGGADVVTLGAFLALPVGLVFWFFARLVRRATLEVGAEGVALSRLWGSRAVSFRDVAKVEAAGGSVTLTLREGAPIRVELGDVWASPADQLTRRERANALCATLSTARAAFDGPARGSSALLARGGRAVPEWRRALAALGSSRETFRAPAFSPERLWEIVEDPAEPADVRVGAALALGGEGGAGGGDSGAGDSGAGDSGAGDERRARLARVAHASVVPRIRVCLEALARDDEDALEDALDEVGREERP